MDAETHAQLQRLNDAHRRMIFGVQDAPGRGGVALHEVPREEDRIHAIPSHAPPTMPPPTRNDDEYVKRSYLPRPNLVSVCVYAAPASGAQRSDGSATQRGTFCSVLLPTRSGFLRTVGPPGRFLEDGAEFAAGGVGGQDGLANSFRMKLGLGPEAAFSSSCLEPMPDPGLLPTDEYTVLSHAHGRQRRVERGIEKLVRDAAWLPNHVMVLLLRTVA